MKLYDNFSNVSPDYTPIFKQNNVPVFQNKIYITEREAKEAVTGNIELVQSPISGFIFNKAFDSSIVSYDSFYQNEQSISKFFQDHLNKILSLLKSFGLQNKKVVEVGCGKGGFFEMMLKEGFDCWGFDPAYEGTNERITKDYFTEKYNDINADVILMRHTLEHIPSPFSFIHQIAKANNYRGNLFIEVPTFNWIAKKKSFWDIFYEHCNYFTEQSLSTMFDESITETFFGGQYMYLWADLSKLRFTIPEGARFTPVKEFLFEEKFNYYHHLLQDGNPFAIWGAGAKGTTFLNLLDPDKMYVNYVIDINPAKQNHFIPGTGHPVFSPNALDTSPTDRVLVMNENYVEEITEMLRGTNIKIYNL